MRRDLGINMSASNEIKKTDNIWNKVLEEDEFISLEKL